MAITIICIVSVFNNKDINILWNVSRKYEHHYGPEHKTINTSDSLGPDSQKLNHTHFQTIRYIT